MSTLLDALHEDQNRVKNKPYVELPDYNGKFPLYMCLMNSFNFFTDVNFRAGLAIGLKTVEYCKLLIRREFRCS